MRHALILSSGWSLCGCAQAPEEDKHKSAKYMKLQSGIRSMVRRTANKAAAGGAGAGEAAAGGAAPSPLGPAAAAASKPAGLAAAAFGGSRKNSLGISLAEIRAAAASGSCAGRCAAAGAREESVGACAVLLVVSPL